MSDPKTTDGGEKLQFSGVTIMEIGQSHLPAKADEKTAEPAAAAAAATKPAADAKPAADEKTADSKPDSKPADAKPAASSDESSDKLTKLSPAASAEPSSGKSGGSLKEPLTSSAPSTPATPTVTLASKEKEKSEGGDAKVAAPKTEEKKPDKKPKKDAKPIRDVNPALAARVKAANQHNRKMKALKDAGLSDADYNPDAKKGDGTGRRNTKEKEDETNGSSPVVVIETEQERMRRERREKKDRLNIGEKVNQFKVEIDPELEARVAAKENSDDTSAMPDVASLLKDNDKHGILEERTTSLIGTSWTAHSCVIKDGHFYWIKDEKKDKEPVGRVKYVKSKIRLEINDSVLEIYDPDVTKKALQTRAFRVPLSVENDFIDSWMQCLKKTKLKFYQARVAIIQKEEEKALKDSGGVATTAVLSPQAAKAAALAQKRKGAQLMLNKGVQLVKHQAGTRYARAVWCSPSMDRLCWGDPKMETVKGFVLLDDITEVATQIALQLKPGAHGISIVHTMHSFSGTDEPVLQFEVDDVHQRDAFVNALRAFTDKQH